MIRLNMIVEGQTEEIFAHQVLKPHLAGFSVFMAVRCVMTSRDKRRGIAHRGGMTTYQRAKQDIQTWLKEDASSDARFTTMFDLYHLPKGFPGLESAAQATDAMRKAEIVEEALRADIADLRLIPYIQLHEFEALLFSDPTQMDWYFIEHQDAIGALLELAGLYPSPEFINDQDPPSRQISALIPEYQRWKTKAGPLVAEKIALPKLREKCPHFGNWVARLESLDETRTS